MMSAVCSWNKDTKIISRLKSYCCNYAGDREMEQHPTKNRSCTPLKLIPELKKENTSSIIEQYTHVKLHLHIRTHQCDYFG